MFAVHPEVLPSLGVLAGVALLLALLSRLAARGWKIPVLLGLNLLILGSAYLLFFFRDPERLTPDNPDLVFAGADGKIMAVKTVEEPKHLKGQACRISIFLSLIDVHVNRAPLAGVVRFADYFPGKRHFTFDEKSSDLNQHSEILIENSRTRCLVNQIVGPIARRVVFWLEPGQRLQAGARIGMMKFGSRLDMYLPVDDVDAVLVTPGQFVVAGETPVASLKPRPEP